MRAVSSDDVVACFRGTEGDDGDAVLRAVLAAQHGLLVRLDADLRIVAYGEPATTPHRADHVGRSIYELIPPTDRDAARACFAEVAASHTPGTFDADAHNSRGGRSRVRTRVAPVLRAGVLAGYVLSSLDITARRDDRERLAIAVQATKVALWYYDALTDRTEWSAEMFALTGHDTPLPLPDYVRVLVHPDDRARVGENAALAMSTGTIEGTPHRIVRPDGSVRWITSLGVVERDADGRLLAMRGGSLDVTDQQARVAQDLHTQRLDALGRMSAGVAHNFNNLLAVIVPTLAMLRDEVSPASRGAVDDAQLAATRATNMVRQLVSFARQGARDAATELNLAEVLLSAVRLGERLVSGVLEVELSTPDPTLVVRGERATLEHAFLNMLVNARDAVVDAGRARGRVRLALEHLPPSAERPLGLARVRVSDDGPGMSAEIRGRVFEPFFTTKAPGRGTGLGLSTAYATVVELGGTLACTSEVGVGTTFEVCLPLVARAVAPGPTPPEAPAATPTDLTILVVDDDPMVRRMLGVVLGRQHFQVSMAAHGDEALELARQRTHQVALVDLTMPGMSGLEVGARLRAEHPALRTLLFTGSAIGGDEAAGFDAVVPKPLEPSALLAVIRRVAAAPAPGSS